MNCCGLSDVWSAKYFRDRFANLPIEIGELSRFISTKNQQAVFKDASTGKIDILIGTHKLLHAKIDYRDLGLLIIDEEHRFGVKQKEVIKEFRTNIDVLTLTATPIPRTLNLSMSGIKDLSIIATAPAKRLSVKTFLREKNSDVIREAVLREILRGGQIFYVHNEVKTIEQTDILLNLVIINKIKNYYEPKENGNIYNDTSQVVGKYINSKFNFNK